MKQKIVIQIYFSWQVIPVHLHLIQAISSVRLYIPKDLRPLDARQNVGKSVQVTKSIRAFDCLIVDCTIISLTLSPNYRYLLMATQKFTLQNWTYVYCPQHIYLVHSKYIYIYILQSTDMCFAVLQLISVAWYNLDMAWQPFIPKRLSVTNACGQ